MYVPLQTSFNNNLQELVYENSLCRHACVKKNKIFDLIHRIF